MVGGAVGYTGSVGGSDMTTGSLPSVASNYWPGGRCQDVALAVERSGVGSAPADAEGVGSCFTALVELVEMALPSSGRIGGRWAALAEVGAADLSVARLFEGHADAVAILAEAGRAADPGLRYGVWASRAGGTRVEAAKRPGGLVLRGTRPYASGAHTLDVALVTVDRGDDQLLVAVDVSASGVSIIEGSWPAVGMAGSDSVTVALDDVAVDDGDVVGRPGFYLERPGFWVGAVGVAACWFGGAIGVCRPLVHAAVKGRLDDHGLAALGEAWSALEAAGALLATTARRVDADGHVTRLEAEVVRAAVVRAAATTVEAVGAGLGAGPLTSDRRHAQRVADLGVYLRQHHAGRDLAELGRALGARRW